MLDLDKYKYILKITKNNLLGYILDKLSDSIDGKPEKFIKSAKKPDLIAFILKNATPDDVPDEKGFKKYQKPVDFVSKLYKSLPKITDKEQSDLLNEKIALYKGNKRKFDLGLKLPNTEGKTEKQIAKIRKDEMNKIIELEPHQKAFLNGFLLSGIHGAIAFHGVGTGKTFTAVAVSRLYLKLFPDNKILFVSPPAILPNFIDSLIAYGIDPRDKRYNFYTYDGFFRSGITAENSLLIIDEAHNFRTLMTGLSAEEGAFSGASSIKSYEMIQRGALTAHKAICLTGTVMVNKIYDIENLISIADGKQPISPDTFSKIAVNEANRYDYFKYRISMYFREIDYKTGKPSPPNTNFPEMREKYIPIVSNEKNILAIADQKENAVYTSSRQASMTNEKIDYCINIIRNTPNKKFVIYTAFKGNVSRIKEALIANGIKYGVVSGDETTKEKQQAISGYNEFYNKKYDGQKNRVLIITRAGAEGVDLRETRGIFIIDGVWNEALSVQIIARAIRFRSHINLPVNERYVDVYKIFVCTPDEKRLIENLNTEEGKKFDFNSYIDKIKEDRELEKQIKSRRGKAYTGRSVIDNNLILKFSNKVKDFDDEYFENLKPKERKEYILKFGTFMKDREKYLANELARITENTPSTDFYLFALQKSKEKVILEFIKALARIPAVEQAFTDRALGKMAKDYIEKAFMNKKYSETKIVDGLIKLMKPKLQNAIETIEASNENISNKLMKILEKGREKDKLKAELLKNRIKQEFFTPTHLVKQLIELSGIHKDKRIMDGGIQVLEPSAGYGAIIKGLLKLMSEKSIDLRMDMVEIIEENRKVLMELVKEVPTYLSLAEQPDFLRYVPNKSYDYIIMNPPFHLRKEGKFDYDFVQRAFAMLKPGGTLVAITGVKYKEFEDASMWYKSKNAEIKVKNVEWREFEEGEKLKNKGMEINNLKIAFIKIQKSNINDKNKNWSLKEDAQLLKLSPIGNDSDTLKEAINEIKQDDEELDVKYDKIYDKINEKLEEKETKEAEKKISLADFKRIPTENVLLLNEKLMLLEQLNKELGKTNKLIYNRRRGSRAPQALFDKQQDLTQKISDIKKNINELKGAGFWGDFAKGFKKGFLGTLDVAKTVLPFVV